MRWVFATLGLVGIVAITAVTVRLSYVASRGGETVPLHSVRRFDPYGAAAAYRLLSERHGGVVRLERPRLDADEVGTLVQLVASVPPETGPNRVRLGDDEGASAEEAPTPVYALPVSVVLEWAGAGNTVVVFTRTPTPLTEELGVTVLAPGTPATRIDEHARRGGFPDGLPGAESVARWHREGSPDGRIALHAPATFEIDGAGGGSLEEPDADAAAPREWRVLATLPEVLAEEGEPPAEPGVVAMQTAVGAGRVILVAAPSPMQNHWIDREDNLEFVLALTARRPVIFDEWLHGIGHTGTIIETIARFGLIPALAQIALVALVLRWRSPDPTIEPTPASGVMRRRAMSDQIELLGALYGRALGPREQALRAYVIARGRLAEAAGVAEHTLEVSLGARGGEAAGRAVAALDRWAAAAAAARPRCQRCGADLSSRGEPVSSCPRCKTPLTPRVMEALASMPKDADDRASTPISAAKILTESAELAEALSHGRRHRSHPSRR